jgi:hypothetical protein
VLESLLRFKDLKECGYVKNWPQLRYMVEHYGFPPGRLVGANSRTWTVNEVADWYASRPSEPSPHARERAEKSKRARKAAAQEAA